MSAPEFQPWPKIPRLNRNIVITEKLDGTNAAIIVTDEGTYAQSRTRILQLDADKKGGDNFGFYRWVLDNEGELRADLGVGLHFGEWFGLGIQRGYGLGEKRFALFNSARWLEAAPHFSTPRLTVVPVLYEGPFAPVVEFEGSLYDRNPVRASVEWLATNGSMAVPGYMKPEGVVVYMSASRTMHKVTLEGDEAPKGSPIQ